LFCFLLWQLCKLLQQVSSLDQPWSSNSRISDFLQVAMIVLQATIDTIWKQKPGKKLASRR